MVDHPTAAARLPPGGAAPNPAASIRKDTSANVQPTDAGRPRACAAAPDRQLATSRKGGEATADVGRYADRIRAEQFAMAARPALTTTFINALNGGIITYAFWSPASAHALGIWCCVNLGFSLLVLADQHFFMRRWAPDPTWPLRIVMIRSVLLGWIWGVLPWLLLPVRSPEGMLAIGIIIAGMIAGGVTRLAIIPSAALLFLWSLVGLACAAIIDRYGAEAIYPVILLLTLAAFLTKYVQSYSTDIFASWTRKYAVEEANDTIALLLSDFQDNASDWLWETDASGNLRNVSARFRQVAGKAPPLEASKFSDLLKDAPAAFHAREAFRDVNVTLSADRKRHWRISGRPTRDAAGRFTGFRGIGSDVTDRVEAENRLAHLRDFDAVTGLANRKRFRDDVANALRSREPQSTLAVLSVETLQFKAISETVGPLAADALLIGIAERLAGCAGHGDIVARISSGKFALLRSTRRALRDISELAERIVSAFDDPIPVRGEPLSIGVRIGVALAAPDMTDPEALIRDAGIALSRSGIEDKLRVVFFEQGMDEKARRRLALEQRLSQAIANDELYLAYQPLLDPETGCVTGCEALLRWSNPESGPVSPAEFIPIAEESGLIVAIGEWVLKTAAHEAMKWPSDILVAVNLSPVQFRGHRVLGAVIAALKESHLPPGRLELEITESAFLATGETTINLLRDLKSLGAGIALDDFGTGYSSLSYLRKFPFDKIKIDKSFVDNIAADAGSAAIVKAIIDLCAALGMTTTAEGVERQDQLSLLMALGCKSIQGYIFSKPLPGSAIGDFIAQRNASHAARIDARAAGSA
jgi:diguanylate cyclase (GGDEF)-like protein